MGGSGIRAFGGDTVMALYWEINFPHSASHWWPESPQSSTRCPEYFGIWVCRKLQRGGSERTVVSLLQVILEMWDFICTWVRQLSSAKSTAGNGIDCVFSKDWAICFSMSSLNAAWSTCLYLFYGLFILSVSNTYASSGLSLLPSLRFNAHVKAVVILGSNSWVCASDSKISSWASFQIIHLYAIKVLWRYKVPCYW